MTDGMSPGCADQVLGFLRVRAPGPDGKPDQEAIAASAKANPETTRQAAFVAGKPLPGSYAGIVYWGVHTLRETMPRNGKCRSNSRRCPRRGRSS